MKKHGMPTDPIERAGAVAADYEALQGLITVGAGISLIVMTMMNTPAYGALLAACAVAVGQGYYFKKYGKVRQSPSQVWYAVGVAILVVLVASVGIIADIFPQLPVMLGPLTGTAALLIFGRLNYRHVGVTRVHLVVVAVLPFGALLPLTGLASANFWSMDLWLLGLALIIIGLVDHNRLVSAMKPVPDE